MANRLLLKSFLQNILSPADDIGSGKPSVGLKIGKPTIEERDNYELPPMDFTRDQVTAEPMTFNMFDAKGGKQPEVVGDNDPRVQAIRTKKLAMAALERKHAIEDGMRYMSDGATLPGEGLIPYSQIMKDIPPEMLPRERGPAIGLDASVYNKYLKRR